LIFCSQSPIKIEEIVNCLAEIFGQEVTKELVQQQILFLEEKYSHDLFVFQIDKSAGGYQFLTKNIYHSTVELLLKQKSKKRLSTAALETLSIIAYKQPISKGEIEQIRGVNCDYAVQKLLDKELIEFKGKAETIGKPMLYGTSSKFMEHFGINKLSDLPLPKDFSKEENSVGEQNT
jgi:segregation and condensation protein B